MNVNRKRIAAPSRMEEAPQPPTRAAGEATTVRSPAQVLSILEPSAGHPRPILIHGLWKTGLVPEPQGA